MRDRLNRMRDLRLKALEAFVQINAQIDLLKDVVGALGNELSALDGEISARAKGGRPNRKPGKYVKLALELATNSPRGLVSVSEVIEAAPLTSTGNKPERQNVSRALVEGKALGHLRAENGSYGHPIKSD